MNRSVCRYHERRYTLIPHIGIADRFIWARDLADPSRRLKAQVVLIAPCALALWGPVFMVIFGLTGEVRQATAVLVTVVVLLCAPVVYIRTASMFLASSTILGSILFGIGSIAFLGGGLDGPAITWTLLVPLLAVYLVGPRWSLVWVSLTAGQMLLAWSPAYRALQYEAANPLWLHAVTQASLTFAAASVTYLFHRTTVAMRRRLSRRTAELEEALELLEDTEADLRREAEQRARAEQQLLHAQKMEAIGQLAAGVAHEINTPIQFIGDTVHFLSEAQQDQRALIEDLLTTSEQRDPDLAAELARHVEARDMAFYDAEVAPAFERVADGVDRVSRIVQAMKAFAHPSTEEATESDLEEALRSTAVVAQNAVKYVADIEYDFHGVTPIPCWLDELNQVFLNLIVNAAQAIDERRDADGDFERGRIVLSTHLEDGWLIVGVEDDGIGMSEDVRRRIFEPFFTTKPVGEGTGQGLSLVHAIIDKHGGHIEVTSRPGAGSTFTLWLPTAVREAA